MKKFKINYGYLFVLPWIIGFIVFTLYPLLTSIQYSFSKVIITATGVKLIPVQWENYILGLSLDPAFVEGIKNMVTQLVLQIPLIIVISIALSMLLNHKFKGVGVYRTIYFLPVVILSGPTISYMDKLGYLGNGNLETQQWYMTLNESNFFLIQIISYLIANISTILWYSGITVLIFLVIIQRINPDLYEAADMDGATPWEKFWKVTLPELKVAINLNIIYLVLFISTFETNEVIVLIKDNMFDQSKGLGYAAMQSWVYMICIFLVLLFLMLCFNGFPKRKKRSKKIKKNRKFKKLIRGNNG